MEMNLECSPNERAPRLRRNVQIRPQGYNAQESLTRAAANGHTTIVASLLAHKFDPTLRDASGRTALSLAAENGHEAVVSLLIKESKILADIHNTDGRTPLTLAAENGHGAIVQLLLNINTVTVVSGESTASRVSLQSSSGSLSSNLRGNQTREAISFRALSPRKATPQGYPLPIAQPVLDIQHLPVGPLMILDQIPVAQELDLEMYGLDYGYPDHDCDTDDDANALSGSAHLNLQQPKEFPKDMQNGKYQGSYFGTSTHFAWFGRDGSGSYYAMPHHVTIPRSLGLLPTMLLENSMNLLYFHHFLDHTAKVLVPHASPKTNLFLTNIPQMAMKNTAVLTLILVYSGKINRQERLRVELSTEPFISSISPRSITSTEIA